MPDVVSDVVINYKSVGLDKVGGDIKQASVALDGLVVASDSAEKATASLENRFASLERQFGTSSGNAEKFAKVQDTVNKAVAQNPELLGRGNELLAAAAARFGEAGKAADAYAKAVETARGAALGLAAGIGPLGAILGSFGPWGIAAAAGIGLVSKAMDYMKEGANKLGDTSASLKQFADNTGMTITQVRGLTNVASDVGVSSDQFGSALQKLTFNLKDARQGSGDLYTQLRMIDRGLADQIASAHSTAEALNILGKAYNAASDATQKAAIARAAFGKEGANLGGVLTEIGNQGADGVNKISDSLAKATGLSKEFFEHAGQLRVQIKSLEEENELLKQSIYATPELERQKQFADRQNEILKTTLELIKAGRQVSFKGGEFDQPMLGQPASTPPKGPAPDLSITDAEIERAETLAKATRDATQAKQDYINQTIRQATESSKLVAILGDAATAEERANARIAELTAAMAQDTEHANIYARAIANVVAQYNALAGAQGAAGPAGMPAGALQAASTQLATITDQNKQWIGQGKEVVNLTGDTGKKLAEIGVNGKVIYDNTSKTASASKQQTQYLDEATDLSARFANGMFNASRATGILANDMVGINTSLATAIRQTQEMMGAAGRGWMADQEYMATSFSSRAAGEPGSFVGSSGGGGGVETTNLRDVYEQQKAALQNQQSFTQQVAAAGAGGIQAALNFAMAQQARAPGTLQQWGVGPGGQIMPMPGGEVTTGQGVTEQDIISQVTSLYSTLNQQNPAAQAANMQAEMAWLQSRPASIAQQQAIAQLQQSIEGLTNSTDQLNATNQELLSPYYTQDPRTSHIGFRSQGMATGGWVDVPGGYSANDNMVATIPVASGERIFVDPMGSRRTATGPGHTTINISQPIMIAGNADKDQLGRTLFQSNQGLAKQINAATAR